MLQTIGNNMDGTSLRAQKKLRQPCAGWGQIRNISACAEETLIHLFILVPDREHLCVRRGNIKPMTFDQSLYGTSLRAQRKPLLLSV